MGLASKRHQFTTLGVPMFGIVHENLPGEVQDFTTFLRTEVYLDAEVSPAVGTLGSSHFYGHKSCDVEI